MAKFRDDPKATVSVTEMANWLVKLEWSFTKDDGLNQRIDQLYEEAQRAEMSGSTEIAKKSREEALRLEGVKTRKREGEIGEKTELKSARNRRVDTFHQSFLKPTRIVD